MDPDALRRFVENHRAVQEREAQEQRGKPLSTADAWAFAMELLRFDEQMNGDPFRRYDPVEEREDLEKYEAWSKLRAGWRRER
jgi:hypothetical protein